MSTAVEEQTVDHQQDAQAGERQDLEVRTRTLPDSVVKRGISEGQWRMLFNLFPGARPESALMVWDYCKARGLDPMKKPCHIVPMDTKDANGNWAKRDVVMPGIYEYRITAHRTGTYLGHSKPEYGPVSNIAKVDAPEWCELTFYRWHAQANRVIEFPVTVFFSEVVATNRDGAANSRWTKAPRQMLTKCAEAAGLREGWPEEFGGEPTAEEMDGQRAIEVVNEPIGEPIRRSERAASATTTAPPPAAAAEHPALTNELPSPSEKGQGSAAASAKSAGKGTTRPAATKPAANNGDGPSVTTTPMVITDTSYCTPKDHDPYWEIRATVRKSGEAPIAFTFLTRDERLYKTAASCEGSETLFTLTWHGGKRPDGSACKVLEKIEAAT